MCMSFYVKKIEMLDESRMVWSASCRGGQGTFGFLNAAIPWREVCTMSWHCANVKIIKAW